MKGRLGKRFNDGPDCELWAPEEFWTMKEDALLEVAGKCGPGKKWGEKLVPETIWGLRVTRACRIHDFMYSELCDATQEEADEIFLLNMIRLIIHGTKIKLFRPPRLLRAITYYMGVAYGGKYAISEK